ncbi:MAG: hypothetical protein LBM77_14445 [Spirochaetaceae bacterium]|jgi:hypothetical protein|nr:hypothetical protein [Spirochaetaceae bacterium]
MDQRHLSHKDTVNLGSFYTPEWLVDIVYDLIRKHVPAHDTYYILDTSCGYGGFLRGDKAIGADIDKKAIETARSTLPNYTYFQHNSLFDISRSKYRLDKNAKMIIVGNPPYNDTTSIIRSDIKQVKFDRDADIYSRDLGISFLMSYDKLEADYVCVLHPLSYLIKKANFEALWQFRNHYKLTDAVVFSSGVFSATSKTTSFPIIIAFYERNNAGMDYQYIQDYKFKTQDGKEFSINQFDSIGHYVSKYPNHKAVSEEDTVAYFYTMRDINALKRTATFLTKENYNAVRVTEQKLPYYCYVDVFKDFIPHIPYYFGNSDIMIDDAGFKEMADLFMARSLQKHPNLKFPGRTKTYNDQDKQIEGYFRHLLGVHYVD